MKTSENGATLLTLSEFNWENIKQPGAYIERETGHLYRIPPEALLRGSSPLITKLCNNQSTFVKLSDDPNTIVSKLRTIAADADVKPNF